MVFLVTLISSILSQFSQPSGMKLFKVHLEQELIQSAMSIYQTIFAIFMVLGPILGTLVYQQFGIMISIGITGIAFLLSAGMLSFIPHDHQVDTVQTTSTLIEEMISGFRYVVSKRELKLLGTSFFIAGLAIGLIFPLSIFIVTDQLGLAKENLQWLLMVNGIGMILGGVLSVAFSKSVPPQKLLILGMFANTIGYSIIGFSTNLCSLLQVSFSTVFSFLIFKLG